MQVIIFISIFQIIKEAMNGFQFEQVVVKTKGLFGTKKLILSKRDEEFLIIMVKSSFIKSLRDSRCRNIKSASNFRPNLLGHSINQTL